MQSQGQMQESSVLSDYLNYNMLKSCYGILLSDTDNKLPTPALMFEGRRIFHQAKY